MTDGLHGAPSPVQFGHIDMPGADEIPAGGAQAKPDIADAQTSLAMAQSGLFTSGSTTVGRDEQERRLDVMA